MTEPTGSEMDEARRKRQVNAAFGGLMLAMLLAALSQLVVATALPTIAGDLGGLDQLGWVITAYLLATTVVMPIYGKLGDLLGRKMLFQVAIAVFVVGSALAGMAQNMEQMIAFRAIQGLGGGGLMISSQAIIGDLVSPRERGRYQGMIGGVFGLGAVLGPLMGGFFVDHLTWRWVFFINIPLGVAVLAVNAVVLTLPRTQTRPTVDYVGAVLIAAAITCLVLLSSWAGTTYDWTSGVIIGLGVATVALLGVWVVAERRTVEAIIPLRLFKDSVFWISCAIALVLGVAMFAPIAYLPTFLQIVTGSSATNSGLLLLPMMAGVVVATVVSGQLITRTGRYKIFPIAGPAIAGVGMYLLSTMDADTTSSTAGVYMAVLGLGLGQIIQLPILVVQNSAPQRDLGIATSTVNLFRTLGGSIGAAVVGSIFVHRLDDQLPRYLPPDMAGTVGADTAMLTPESVATLPPEIQHGIAQAFSQALPPAFGYVIPLLALATILAIALKERPLRTTTVRRS